MKTQFEVGKWYKNTVWYSKAGKVKSYNNKTVSFSEYISERGEHLYFNFKNTLSNTFIEVPLSEINEYLPDGHPDKITKDIPEYVECVYSFGWGRSVKKGVIYDTKVDIPGTKRTWESRLRDYPEDFKPSTKEAFEKQNKEVMSKQKLTVPVTDVLKIHSIACDTWKSKIASDYLPRVNSDQNIKFSQIEIDSMFKAATKSQLSVLEEVFGKQSKPIDWDKIQAGSQVMIKYSGEHCGGFDVIDKSKPVTVIFFNTPYMIMSNGTFLSNGSHPKYCTFNQNGKFVFFTSENETYKNYIVEVVQY